MNFRALILIVFLFLGGCLLDIEEEQVDTYDLTEVCEIRDLRAYPSGLDECDEREKLPAQSD